MNDLCDYSFGSLQLDHPLLIGDPACFRVTVLRRLGRLPVTLPHHTAGSDGELNHRCWGLDVPSLRVSARPRRCRMATITPSAALVPAAPVFANTERLALAGFLAGYSGLTRQAYELDLRQYASWCHQHHLRLFQARRADIECFARDLETRGRARATITRRLRRGLSTWPSVCAWTGRSSAAPMGSGWTGTAPRGSSAG